MVDLTPTILHHYVRAKLLQYPNFPSGWALSAAALDKLAVICRGKMCVALQRELAVVCRGKMCVALQRELAVVCRGKMCVALQ